MIECVVGNERIDPSKLIGALTEPGHGAQTYFFGAVRESNAGRVVVAVEYDAFPQLAEVVLRKISEEAQAKWGPGLRIKVQHRTGRLGIGEVSVAIGVSSRHRDEAFQGSRYIIEQIKLRLPVWKKEFYVNGETEWLKGHELCQKSHLTEAASQHASHL